jgi:hypothetical protein
MVVSGQENLFFCIRYFLTIDNLFVSFARKE